MQLLWDAGKLGRIVFGINYSRNLYHKTTLDAKCTGLNGEVVLIEVKDHTNYITVDGLRGRMFLVYRS